MRRIRLLTVSALVVLGVGSAACSAAPQGESKAIAKNSTASALPSSTTSAPSSGAPSSAPSITTPSSPFTTTTLVLPTTTSVPKPPSLHRCPPGDRGKNGTVLGAAVVCTHTTTGYYWEPAS